MLLVILTVKTLLEHVMKKNCQKQIKNIRIEKIIKKKGDKLYIKWKGYDNSFSSCIDRKGVIK